MKNILVILVFLVYLKYFKYFNSERTLLNIYVGGKSLKNSFFSQKKLKKALKKSNEVRSHKEVKKSCSL